MINLRQYQVDAIESVRHDWQAGYRDVLGVAATGLGKTAIFLGLLHAVLSEGKRALILAHRKELIEQPADRMVAYYPDWEGRIGIVMADRDEIYQPITVATVQTLSSQKRLEGILAHGPIDYLITDEAHHHTDKNTYMGVTGKLHEANPGIRHLGVTATPLRTDGDGLGGVYQKESFHYPIGWGIKNGFLVNIRWLAIESAISLDGIKTIHGDFQQSALGKIYETDDLLELVVRSYREYASERQAIAFTVTVEGAYRLQKAFRAAGIPAAAADGTTDKKDRARILGEFSQGETKILCNVGLFTEGLDMPQASCILMARPTKSDSLYVQCMGRALRLFPGKEDALILDFAPVNKRNVVMAGDVLGVPIPKTEIFEKGKERGKASAGFTYDGGFTWMDGSPVEIISRQLNYLEQSPWSWYRKDGWLSLGLGKASDGIERTLLISPESDGQLILWGIAKRGGEAWKSYQIMAGGFDALQLRADQLCDKWGNASLAAKTRKWRKEQPTEKQVSFARRIHAHQPGMSKGELAQAITHSLAMRAIEHES